MKFPLAAIAMLGLAAALAPPIPGQCAPSFSLPTPAPNNGHSGEMFDLEPTGGSPLRIESFDVLISVTTPVVYEVWVRAPLQSFVGFNNTMAGWTLLGTSNPVTAVNSTTPVPLNLCLGYTLQAGGRTGFYVTLNAASGTSNRYANGTGVGNVWASDPRITVYDGMAGAYFACTNTPRSFTGIIRYSLGHNILSLSQGGPGVGDLLVSIASLSPTAGEGFTLISSTLAPAVGTGPILGIEPDALTWSIFGFPYFPGNPFHFVATDPGVFPGAPFYAPPGSLGSLTGTTLDFVVVMLNVASGYDSRSNVIRHTFQ
jgi:hypothetical protein